ncbi:MAG: FMN-dependent NADH-azoreductase [Chitinispirillaceae bacterium]
MSTVLYIKANAKPQGQSRTFRISDEFIRNYGEHHPDDEIVTLDLYKEKIGFLTGEDMEVVFGPKTEDSRNHPILKYAYQFAEADKYVIAEPMWNLNIPAILKAYIDYIVVVGITFEYTEKGAAGLLEGKKAVNIISRGGDYCSEPYCAFEMGDRYMKTIFSFLGVDDYTTIAADKLDIVGEDVEAIIEETVRRARNVAVEF